MNFIRISFFFLSLLPISAVLAQNETLRLTENNVEQVIEKMTLEEKVHMVLGVRGLNADEKYLNKVEGAAGQTYSIERLGIPATVLVDGPAGVRIDNKQLRVNFPVYGTAFPTASAMAATWNLSLEEEVGKAMGKETLHYGADVLLAPGLNIQRNPLTGRNFEYFSEDPLVSGKMSAALVNGIQSTGVGASIKHFAVNNIETNRHEINAVVSQRTLREIYLRGFEIAIKESKPWTVMSSYNRVNGVHVTESTDLLKTILRNEWGFDGLVLTDWFSGTDWVGQVRGGSELIMPGTYQADYLIRAIKTGLLDEKQLDRNVKYVLQYVLKTPAYKSYIADFKVDNAYHSSLARKAAQESIVLLKNDKQALPIGKKKRVALFGKSSYELIPVGVGSGKVNHKDTPSVYISLLERQFIVDKETKNFYSNYIKDIYQKNDQKSQFKLSFSSEPKLDYDLIKKNVSKNDIAVITLGRNAGEGKDRSVNEFFELSPIEREIIKNVSDIYHAVGKKVVVVLNVGSPIETASWRDMPDAILMAWQTGQEAGDALVDILSGSTNPSGKIAVTFPINYKDVPSSDSFPGEPKKKPLNAYYNEGIYVGYRYYDTFEIPVSYEFGHGLSYSTFDYSNISINSNKFNEKMEISVTVKNTGKFAGKESVQLYVSAPQSILEKPNKELKDFAKTQLLKPGQSETLNFLLNEKDLASFYTSKSQWIADAGEYKIMIGASSKKIMLQKNFFLEKPIVVETVNDVLYPNGIIREISKKNPIVKYPIKN